MVLVEIGTLAAPQEVEFVYRFGGLHVVDNAAEEVFSRGHQELLTDGGVKVDWLDPMDEFPLKGKQVEHELVAGVLLIAIEHGLDDLVVDEAGLIEDGGCHDFLQQFDFVVGDH